MVICLERCADLHMAQLMPLPLTVSCSNKIQISFNLPFWYRLTWVVPDKGPLNVCVLPFWYRPTRVVPDKGSLNGCVCVCVFLLDQLF